MTPNVDERGTISDGDLQTNAWRGEGLEYDPLNGSAKHGHGYRTCDYDRDRDIENNAESDDKTTKKPSNSKCPYSAASVFKCVLEQIPAVGLVCLLNLMMSVPFGSVYFPVEWGGDGGEDSSVDGGSDSNESANWGEFPLKGKDVLGIRMCLFASIIGQIVFTFKSTFVFAVGFQMIENIPFYHSIAFICFKHQGGGMGALSTMCFVMALSSVIVGIVFYVLGKFELGKIVHFFPKHVLLGLIGGIGVFVMMVAFEMTMNSPFALTVEGIRQFIAHWNLISLVIYLEATLLMILALIRRVGMEVPALISPIYFLLITPFVYLGIWVLKIDRHNLVEQGYFFPHLGSDGGNLHSINSSGPWAAFASFLIDEHTFDMWKVYDLSNISWLAVSESLPIVFCLVLFSLLHVPINIPALAVSTKTNTDMNQEMKSHGWSNFLSGLFGGLQNYITYSNSLAYARAGGCGRVSSIAIVLCTVFFFFVGPVLVPYIPRCMAGALLLHIGFDLFMEGIYEHYDEFDAVEYTGIWVIIIVMSFSSLEYGLVAGVFWALFTYAFQSGMYTKPVSGVITAATLRSTKQRRHDMSMLLNDPNKGMSKVLIVSLDGHLFFGNITQFEDKVRERLAATEAWIVIFDFTHVTSIDCSFAEAITKMKETMNEKSDVQHVVFVSGSHEGFPCKYDLSGKLPSVQACVGVSYETFRENLIMQNGDKENWDRRTSGTSFRAPDTMTLFRSSSFAFSCQKVSGDYVCINMNSALSFCEDALIAWEHPNKRLSNHEIVIQEGRAFDLCASRNTEEDIALRHLHLLSPDESTHILEQFFGYFTRETSKKSQTLWSSGDASDCAKLLLAGRLVSILEGQTERNGEVVEAGAMIGELGLVTGDPRLSTLYCLEDCILFSLNRARWDEMIHRSPQLETLLFRIATYYLSNKLKLVSDGSLQAMHRRMPI